MTVDYLLKKLQELKDDGAGNAEIRLHDRNGETALFILQLVNDNEHVWIETESDVDMAEEIQTRFNDAIELGLDECDVYAEMLETGIDVEMVRKYMGDDVADSMQIFCEEHGLI